MKRIEQVRGSFFLSGFLALSCKLAATVQYLCVQCAQPIAIFMYDSCCSLQKELVSTHQKKTCKAKRL